MDINPYGDAPPPLTKLSIDIEPVLNGRQPLFQASGDAPGPKS